MAASDEQRTAPQPDRTVKRYKPQKGATLMTNKPFHMTCRPGTPGPMRHPATTVRLQGGQYSETRQTYVQNAAWAPDTTPATQRQHHLRNN